MSLVSFDENTFNKLKIIIQTFSAHVVCHDFKISHSVTYYPNTIECPIFK